MASISADGTQVASVSYYGVENTTARDRSRDVIEIVVQVRSTKFNDEHNCSICVANLGGNYSTLVLSANGVHSQ